MADGGVSKDNHQKGTASGTKYCFEPWQCAKTGRETVAGTVLVPWACATGLDGVVYGA